MPGDDDRRPLAHDAIDAHDVAGFDEHGLPRLHVVERLTRTVASKDARRHVERDCDTAPCRVHLASRTGDRLLDGDADRSRETGEHRDRCRVGIVREEAQDRRSERAYGGDSDDERARVGEIAGGERETRDERNGRERGEGEARPEADVADHEERHEEPGCGPDDRHGGPCALFRRRHPRRNELRER